MSYSGIRLQVKIPLIRKPVMSFSKVDLYHDVLDSIEFAPKTGAIEYPIAVANECSTQTHTATKIDVSCTVRMV